MIEEPLLSERDWEILAARKGFGRPPRTYREIGLEVGLSRERIRQIRESLRRRLRDAGIEEEELDAAQFRELRERDRSK